MIAIFELIDALPKLRKLARGEYGAGIRRRVARLFPDRPAAEHDAIMHRFLRYRLANRIIYRLTLVAPDIAAIVSAWVPVIGKVLLVEANARGGPIIVATAHLGSLYFMSFVVGRALRGRRLYVIHKKTIPDAARDEAFLRSRGIIPVGGDEHGLLTLVRVIQNDPQAAILLAFDAPLTARHVVPFLATRLPVSTGVGFLADIGRCAVVPVFWHYDGCRPSVFVEEPIFADPALPANQRRVAVVEALYDLLAQRVARVPEQWQLDFIHETAAQEIDDRRAPRDDSFRPRSTKPARST